MYTAPEFFEMVGGAEIIVSGQITALAKDTYQLKVDRRLAGKYDSASIEIIRFNDWVCARRYAPYAVGQRLVAFINKDEYWSAIWKRDVYRVMSAGGEGEFPIEGDVVICRTVSQPNLAVSAGTHLPRAPKVPLDDLYSAIEGYRSLYSITLGRDQNRVDSNLLLTTKIRRLCAQSPASRFPLRSRTASSSPLGRLQAYANQSFLHRYLVNSTEQFAVQFGAGDVGWKLPPRTLGPEPTVTRYRAALDENTERLH